MLTSIRAEDSARALALVHSHFSFLNEGNLVAAREQLFFPPGMDTKPLDVYVETMRQMAPFQLVSSQVTRIDELRRKRHGVVASIWVNVEVRCSLGERSADIVVWWFPDGDKCQISARPSHWVVEKLGRGPDTA
jgi:hypothetical protein